MKRDYRKTLRACSKAMFGVYIVCLIYFLFFAESTGRTFEGRSYHYNLELFKEIRRFIVYRHTLGTKAVALNLFGNIAAFIPFGFFLPSARIKGLYSLIQLTAVNLYSAPNADRFCLRYFSALNAAFWWKPSN